MHLTKQAAQEDVYQLARLLSESHPDPYSAGGGPIAFHQKVEDILAQIPENGLDSELLLRLLRPLVASIQDGHTWIGTADSSQEAQLPRPWLDWDAVEQQLYISAVYRPEDRKLLGARLLAIEGIPFAELVDRVSKLYGCDNEYQKLTRLANAFADPALLADILQQEKLPQRLHLTLLMPDGTQRDITLPLSEQQPGTAITPQSTISLPQLNAAQLAWSFLDEQRHIAYLRATSMLYYREAFEFSQAVGNSAHLEYFLDDTVRGALQENEPIPESIEAKIAAIPSATDLLQELFAAMQQAKTPYLIVDVRHNPGGNSLFALMLEYFLYGLEGMIAADDGYQVKRYSPLYFANRQSQLPEQFQQALLNGGYDFTDEQAWQRRQRTGISSEYREYLIQLYQRDFSYMPTFMPIFEKRAWEASWTPRVIVLTSADTYSAGFDTALILLRHGAQIIGVPSAQAGNCFIDALFYRLDHSGFEGAISYKWSVQFPHDHERGKMLRPDVELSYDYLAAQQFDPNATVKLALEQIEQVQEKG